MQRLWPLRHRRLTVVAIPVPAVLIWDAPPAPVRQRLVGHDSELVERIDLAVADHAAVHPLFAEIERVLELRAERHNSPELVEACLAHDEARALEIGGELAAVSAQVGMLNYTSSKRALSRWLRRASIMPHWAGAGIALNAVAPGTVITPMMKDMLATPEMVAMVDAHAPILSLSC